MILVNCAQKQNEVIKIVEDIKIEEENKFKFSKKEGIRLIFESTYEDDEKACILIKNAIKAAPFGCALYFNVVSMQR